MTEFITYRNGAGDMPDRLKAAVGDLDLALPVTGTGGALSGEVWLMVKKGE